MAAALGDALVLHESIQTNMSLPDEKVLRSVSGREDKLLGILGSLRFARVDGIKIHEGKVTHMEIHLSVNFEDPEAFKKAIEELRTIAL